MDDSNGSIKRLYIHTSFWPGNMKLGKKAFVVEIKNKRSPSKRQISIWGDVDLKAALDDAPTDGKAETADTQAVKSLPTTKTDRSKSDESAE
ncbi:hypothetical protein MOV66_27345 [Agrobacterium sp. SHOUNA12C]|uniref:hypothetical protein n=1 Tax=Rhizobium rhizogenes TaxID=359 RepID=UPI000648BF36|nr:hypothetical protein [Rhizobium rhizogenes]MCJ9724758.1 hypothetical protein [Agrobacterium sp. BETTINA12B]MCJ9760386.1 hypothetical protein [Agrobacterium sp. SHOUNA12C]